MKKKDEWYEIVDLEKFVETTRIMIFDAFGKQNIDITKVAISIKDLKKEEQIEIETVLNQKEAMLITQEIVKKKHGVYTLNNKTYSLIIEKLNERLVGNMLANLTNRGLLDSAFDSELNDFVFWVPSLPEGSG